MRVPRRIPAPWSNGSARLGRFLARRAMSRPRFLADNDLNDAIAVGLLRREPAMFPGALPWAVLLSPIPSRHMYGSSANAVDAANCLLRAHFLDSATSFTEDTAPSPGNRPALGGSQWS